MTENDKKLQEEILPEINDLLHANFEEVFRKTPINKDTECGYGIFKGEFLQK